MLAKIGVAPILWTNDDLPELGGDTSIETCLSEARSAGFLGIEMGGKFPQDTTVLSGILKKHNLALCGGWYSGQILKHGLEEEKQSIQKYIDLFKALNAPCIVYGETTSSVQTKRNVSYGKRPVLEHKDIITYAHKITQLAQWCMEQGMPLAFHHHMGTVIETEEELDTLMFHSGEALKLAYDPGHMAFAKGDTLRVINNHAKRIIHFHAKDVRYSVLDHLNHEEDSFIDAVLKGVFTVPGDGSLDFNHMIKRLADHGYSGWFVLEAEQDPSKANPYEYAKKGYNELVKLLNAARYTIAHTL